MGIEWRGTLMSTLYQNLMEKLYDPDLSDADNAKVIGCSRSSVTIWRQTRGYESKFSNVPIDSDKLKELHSNGLSDLEIARKLRVSTPGVWKCRTRLGLQSNITGRTSPGRPIKLDYDAVEKLYDSSLTDRENAQKAGISERMFNKWRNFKGYKPRKRKIKFSIDEFIYLCSTGLSNTEIALELKISISTAWKYRKMFGMNTNNTSSICKEKRETLKRATLYENVSTKIPDCEKTVVTQIRCFMMGSSLNNLRKGSLRRN